MFQLRVFVMTPLVFAALATPSQAQTASAAPPATSASRVWVTAGGGSTALKGDCSTCENPTYVHAGSLQVNVGFKASPRLDGGVEFVWVPSHTRNGDDVRTTFLMGVGQYRPLRNHGWFLKGGMGIAFVRNWIYDPTNDVTPPFTTNAMSLTYGAGWEFRTRSRVGLQIYGAHSIVALGDLTVSNGTAEGQTVENVVGNYWTIGASIVIR